MAGANPVDILQGIWRRQAIDFNELLTANGLRSTVHGIPDVAHSYMGETPEKTKIASIQALELSLEFMNDVFK